MKPKEALLKGGRIEAITRGRISAENHAWLAERAAEGWVIDGYTVKAATEATPATVEKTTTTNVKVVAEAYIRYPLGKYRAFTIDDHTEVTMRAACFNCHYSLVGHLCDEPLVLVQGRSGYHPVKVELVTA